MPKAGLVRPPLPARPKSDWTVLTDDVACHRVRTCTLCGTRLDHFTLESWSNGGVVAAVLLCPSCRRGDPAGAAVCAKLERRYAPERSLTHGAVA